MTKKTIYIITGLVALFGSLIGLQNDIDSYKTQINGELITVKVTYVPNCIGTKRKYHFKFQYIENGEIKEYSKSIGGKLCDELVIGQDLIMKTNLQKKIFLYEKEDVRIEFYASGLFALVGITLLIIAFKK